MSAKEFIPQNIVNTIKLKRCSDSDDYSILPLLIELNDVAYYYVHYKKSDRYLIIRRDGKIPNLEEAKPVIKMAAFFVAVSHAFENHGKDWAESNTVKVYSRVLSLLNKLESSLAKSESHQLNNLLHSLKKMAKTVIEQQRELQNVVERGTNHINAAVNKKVTTQDRVLLEELQTQLLKCVYEQNNVQLETYETRKKALKLIRKELSFYKIRSWLAYLELKTHYQRMLSRDKLSYEKLRDKEIVKKRISGKSDPDDERVIKSIISKTINPK